MSGSPGAASPASLSGDDGSGGWRHIFNPVEALLPRVEELAADRARLDEINKIQQELSDAREKSLHARLLQAEESRTRWKTAYIELPLFANPKIIELEENDLKDCRTCEDDDKSQLKVQLLEAKTAARRQNKENHEGIAEDLSVELRKLKQAYKTLSSNKDKEICALRGVEDFLWNKLRTIEKDHMVLLKIKEVEAAQAIEAAQKLQQNIEEMQVAAQNVQQNIEEMKVADRKKDDMVRRLQAEADNANERVIVLRGKLLEMHSLVKEENDEIQELKNGQSETLKRKYASYVSNENSQECSEDKHEMDLEEYTETSEECSKDIDEMDLVEDTAVKERRTALFMKKDCLYRKKKELAAVVADPAEIQSLKDQLAEAQKNAAEISEPMASLKNSVSLSELATKLSERDAQHDHNTTELRAQARKAEALQEEVDRLKRREEELARQMGEYKERLEASHRDATALPSTSPTEAVPEPAPSSTSDSHQEEAVELRRGTRVRQPNTKYL